MQLSEHDLKQLDEETIRSLAAEKLRTLSLKLLADLKEARDRLNQTPDNSSRPPSSRAPWERASQETGEDDEQKDEEPGEAEEEGEAAAERNAPPGGPEETQDSKQDERRPAEQRRQGKPGKRAGAPGYGRGVELAVTAEHTHRPSECALCAEALPADAPQRAYTGRYEIDIAAPSSGAPGLELTHTCTGTSTVSAGAVIGRVRSPGVARMRRTGRWS
jgi:transposase